MGSTVQIYDLLPYAIREGDGDGALRALFDAVQQEYERHRTEIRGLALLIDAEGLNTTYQFQGQPVFDYRLTPEKLLLGKVLDNETVQLVTNIAPISDFYTGYGLRVLRPAYDADGDGVAEEDQDPAFPVETANAYTKVIDYAYDSGTETGTMTVFPALPDELVGLDINVAFELSMPRFLYLPATDINGQAINTSTNYYRDWYVRIFAGPGGTPIQTRKITSYRMVVDANGDPLSYILGVDVPFDIPPVATSRFGITPSVVSLNYLAQQVGYEPEATDPEILQKQQIMSAVQAYKLKGTVASFQLLFKAFGFQSRITERFSNYAHAPADLPGVVESPQHDDSALGVNIGQPRYIDEVVLRPIFKDGFDSGDLSRWDSAATTGTGLIAVTAGQAKLTFTNTSSAMIGKHVGYPVTGTQSLGLVVDFDMNPDVTIPASGEFVFFDVSDGPRTNVFIKFTLYDTTHTIRYNTGAGYVDTGISITTGIKTHLRFRLVGSTVQIYVNGTLRYDSIIVPFAYTYGSDTYIYPQGTPVTGVVSGSMFYDNVQVQYPDNMLLSSGRGEDAVTGVVWKKDTGTVSDMNSNLRIPDSDITVVLRKVHPDVAFTPDVFRRIIKRIEDIRPVHVEVALIASAFDENEKFKIKDQFNPTFQFFENVAVGEDLSVIPDSVATDEALNVSDVFLIILSDIRWDVSDNRFDGEDEARWDTD